MTTRRQLLTFAGIWSAAVLCVLIAMWMTWSDRLPDRLASHWSVDGPDQSVPSVTWLVTIMALPVITALIAILLLLKTDAAKWRYNRWGILSGLMGVGGLAIGLNASVIAANLDLTDWREADTSVMAVALTLAPAAASVGVAWLLAGRNSDVRPEPSGASTLVLSGSQKAAWMTTQSAPRWVGWANVALLLTAVVTAALSIAGLADIAWYVPLLIAALVIPGSLFTMIMVSAGRRGVTIRFGMLGWPLWRIPLSRIESAHTEDRMALELGGWGIRITPRGTAIMIKSGSCLVLRRKNRKNMYISLADADAGAALINGLIKQNSSAR